MTKKRISIHNCNVAGFADELEFTGLEVSDVQTKRVSRIIPVNLLLRGLFYLIRLIVPDNSNMAEWTRGWGCEWRVMIESKVFGPFASRPEAISFEKEEIHRMGTIQIAVNTDA